MKIHQFYQKFLDANLYPRQLNYYKMPTEPITSAYLQHHGKLLINFSASDYLGLAKHELLVARAHAYAQEWGIGGTASRLVAGNFSLYAELEQKLAQALGKPAALILGTGYQTNISVLEALLDTRVLGQKALVFCDKYCHVSMLTQTQYIAEIHRFRHNDLNHLKTLLTKYITYSRPVFILAESVYSMDGDQANLPGLIELAKQYQALLYIDDAHSIGVYGPAGFGKAVEYATDIDIIMGTFSKGFGSFGAYIGCSELIKKYLINKCRGLIYSTGLSPAILGAIDAALELMPQLAAERQQLLHHAENLRNFMQQNNLNIGQANSHLIPWLIGDAEKTLKISQLLEEQGILATTIRPPSVPNGQSRIRFCLSAKHSEQDLEKLKNAILHITGRSWPKA